MEKMKPYLNAVSGGVNAVPPIWLMRQAGRYLPEYRKVREKAGSFLTMAYTPEYAVEVTLQPIRRYGMDAAILFSDILVVPDALGQKVSFEAGHGPQLKPLDSLLDLSVDQFHHVLDPVYAAVSGIRYALKAEGFFDTALIGFAGAPWTVACYMIEGSGSKDFIRTKSWAYGRREEFRDLIDLLIGATADYLIRQIKAGAEAVQLFDSWAGLLPASLFEEFVIEPTAEIVKRIRAVAPAIPIIGFPKGVGIFYTDYIAHTGVDAVSVDFQISPQWIHRELQKKCPVQGNLDPSALLVGGDIMRREVDVILQQLADAPFVFNLGHGIHKDTPPAHVAELVQYIRTVRK